MSLFVGQKGLRSQFEKRSAAEIAAANSKPNAKQLLKFNNLCTQLYLDNTLVNGTTPVDVVLYLVHPEGIPTDTDFQLDWLEVPGLRVLNFNVGDSPMIQFEPGTRIFIYLPAGSLVPNGGFFRAIAW